MAAKPGTIVNGGAAKQAKIPKTIDRTPKTYFTRSPLPKGFCCNSIAFWCIYQHRCAVLRIYSVFSAVQRVCTRRMAEKRDIYKDFGRRLRALRDARGMTQERLAELADLDRTYIGDAELGKRNPSLRSIDKLASALDVDLLALLSDDKLDEAIG